jgi:hypothetical protein
VGYTIDTHESEFSEATGVPVFFRIGLDVGSGVKVRKPHAEHMFSGCSDS